MRITRYTPDFDRKTVEEALRLGGYPRFLTALRGAPEVGQVVLGGGQPFAIRYARETTEAAAVVLADRRPVFFAGAGRAGAKPREGYEVAVLRLRWCGGAGGAGPWRPARVRPDGAGGVLLDDYAEEPLELTNITQAFLALRLLSPMTRECSATLAATVGRDALSAAPRFTSVRRSPDASAVSFAGKKSRRSSSRKTTRCASPVRRRSSPS